MDGSGPKWNNPLSNIIGVNSLRLGGFQALHCKLEVPVQYNQPKKSISLMIQIIFKKHC